MSPRRRKAVTKSPRTSAASPRRRAAPPRVPATPRAPPMSWPKSRWTCRNWWRSSSIDLVSGYLEGAKMRALVIDDSRTTRIIIGKILQEIGLEVLEARDGLEALEQVKRNPDVELLLVDWN